jgi:hypothetical protein
MKNTATQNNGSGSGGICPHCGAKMVEYRHSMTIPLVTGLRAILRSGGGPINIKELHLTRNQWDNFQKLRYWGLVFQVEIDGQRKKGVWQITKEGIGFLFNESQVPKRVWTYRGETVRVSNLEMVRITQIVDWYEKREDYNLHSRPHDDEEPELPF